MTRPWWQYADLIRALQDDIDKRAAPRRKTRRGKRGSGRGRGTEEPRAA